jgi:hypothetical protein
MSMKNSNDIVGNGTHDLPTCSAVREPSAPPRTSFTWMVEAKTSYHSATRHVPGDGNYMRAFVKTHGIYFCNLKYLDE